MFSLSIVRDDRTMMLRIIGLLLCLCQLVQGFTTGSVQCERIGLPSPLAATDGVRADIKGVTLKIAFDSQGGVADLSSEKSERFTCGESLDMVHRLRRDSDAVLVGRSTVEVDDCTLTVRRVDMPSQKKQPVRVIVDPKLELKLDDFKIFQDGLETIVIHALADENNEQINDVPFVEATKKYPNVSFVGIRPIDEDGKLRLCTKHMCEILADEFDIHHIMVEGGPNTAISFLKDGTVDRAILVYAPISFKDPLLSNMSTTTFQEAGLEQIGTYTLGVDSVKCYSRPDIPWPSTEASSWP